MVEDLPYFTFAGRLGNVSAWTNSSGGFVNGSLAGFDPFGNHRTTPDSSVNPAITNHGFTGHRHNNTGPYPTQNVGLIYMNARYYLPEVGRFISPDSIVPEPGNPQSFNRYSYVLNSPTNYTDPSGFCAGDPSNNNPFNEFGDAIAHFDCTLENFDALPIADRLLWIQLFMQQTDTFPWFNNIAGIIQGFVENGLADSGSWLSVVDAAILQGIQDGFANSIPGVQNGIVGIASTNPGKTNWSAFFDEEIRPDANENRLIELWGVAEAASTKYGEAIAADAGIAPNSFEAAFLITGNAYRWAASHGGLGRWALSVSPILNVNPIVAYKVGEWFNDPRSTDPFFNRSPVYWYSSAIWEVQSWYR